MQMTTVLLVDDDQRLLEGLARLLNRRMFLVHTASDAIEAQQVLREHPIDVVVTDENMPGLRGTQFLQVLVNEYPNVARVLMTGEPRPGVASLAIGAGGVFRFLVKPIDPEYLVKVVEKAAREHTPPAPQRRVATGVTS